MSFFHMYPPVQSQHILLPKSYTEVKTKINNSGLHLYSAYYGPGVLLQVLYTYYFILETL